MNESANKKVYLWMREWIDGLMDRWKDGSMDASMHESVVRWDRCLDGWMNKERNVWGGGSGQGSSKRVDEFKK